MTQIIITCTIIAFIQGVGIVFANVKVPCYLHLLLVLGLSDIVLGFYRADIHASMNIVYSALFLLTVYTICCVAIAVNEMRNYTPFRKFSKSEVVLITDVAEYYRSKGINNIRLLYNYVFITYALGWSIKNSSAVIDPRFLCSKEWNNALFYNSLIKSDKIFKIKNGKLYNEYIEDAYSSYITEDGEINRNLITQRKKFPRNIQVLLDLTWRSFSKKTPREIEEFIQKKSSFIEAKETEDYVNPLTLMQDVEIIKKKPSIRLR